MEACQRVLITGAGRGLGAALVDEFLASGWEVWGVDLHWPESPQSGMAGRIEASVTDPSAVTGITRRLRAAGGVHALVNNAAIFPLEPWDELTADLFGDVLHVNVIGAFMMSQALARVMKEQGLGGAIVNIGSLTFNKGIASGVHYAASKGAVVGMTRSLARALGPVGVRVNAVAPGLMATEGVMEQVELGRFDASRLGGADPDRVLAGATSPRGVARVARFLASEEASEITGQVVAADGGSIFL